MAGDPAGACERGPGAIVIRRQVREHSSVGTVQSLPLAVWQLIDGWKKRWLASHCVVEGAVICTGSFWCEVAFQAGCACKRNSEGGGSQRGATPLCVCGSSFPPEAAVVVVVVQELRVVVEPLVAGPPKLEPLQASPAVAPPLLPPGDAEEARPLPALVGGPPLSAPACPGAGWLAGACSAGSSPPRAAGQSTRACSQSPTPGAVGGDRWSLMTPAEAPPSTAAPSQQHRLVPPSERPPEVGRAFSSHAACFALTKPRQLCEG